MRIYVLERVHERHSELSDEDVVTAFRSVMAEAERKDGTWMAIGLDGHGRSVELLYTSAGTDIAIYHAFTPPTKKFIRQINQLLRRKP